MNVGILITGKFLLDLFGQCTGYTLAVNPKCNQDTVQKGPEEIDQFEWLKSVINNRITVWVINNSIKFTKEWQQPL